MTPNSNVAAMIPNASAGCRPRRLRSTLSPCLWTLRAVALLAGAVLVVSCNETSAPILRYPLLDEVGQSDWQTVSAGAEHTCALKTDGTAYCWGSNQYGQLGTTATDTMCVNAGVTYPCADRPTLVSTSLKFLSISAGQRHTCAITTARDAYCWGGNDQGQLAGASPDGPELHLVPTTLPWTQISAGYAHTCAVRSDGALYCWGQNDRGQLGNAALTGTSTPLRVSIANPIASVSTAQGRTCARTTTGVVYCFGAIWVVRQAGNELQRSQPAPVVVSAAPAMSTVSIGSFTSCGLDLAGFAYCWEANQRGQIGDGTVQGDTMPTRVATKLQFVQLSAGIVQTCGVTTGGVGYCWGDDGFGELGVPNAQIAERCGDTLIMCSTKPIAVLGRQSFTEISTGLGSHTCGVTTRGNLYCWGFGTSGQRGDATIRGSVTTPISVAPPK
jgi:alpha-tubulin suppressor-like RCC1 family protein